MIIVQSKFRANHSKNKRFFKRKIYPGKLLRACAPVPCSYDPEDANLINIKKKRTTEFVF